jgi:DNA-3-methyladenine glycosylase
MPRKFWKRSVSMPKRVTPDNRRASAGLPWKLLPRSFFDASPEKVARELLGKILLHRVQGVELAGRIVETEAYMGENDPAAHSASGKTARNAVLFGPPGHAYVYNIYGLHQCMNVSCLPDGNAGGVLMRALEPLSGIEQMRQNRLLSADAELDAFASGPGKLCQALSITRASDNGRDLTEASSPLGLYEDGFQCGEISARPRIGISKAADLPLRFFLAGHACVSIKGR